jgi:4-hydroxythreonine-4-phosphate dehydrogenase
MIKPRIGITIGDPAGIGPEIALKVLSHPTILEACSPSLIGSLSILNRENPEILKILDDSRVKLIDVKVSNPSQITPGIISKEAGQASFEYMLKAISLAKASEIDAIVTAPITKASLKMANIPYLDHTEILDKEFNNQSVTLLATPELRVSHVMRHMSLKDSVTGLTEQLVFNTITQTNEVMNEIITDRPPKILVAGLNPHNSDNGLMGNEEETIIKPAIKKAKEKGVDVSGPIAADSVFPKAILGECDVVVAMYHDQGHIAIKTNNWRKSIGLTLGSGVLRTSADHGSALDIAGKNIAHEDSLLEALQVAIQILNKGKV